MYRKNIKEDSRFAVSFGSPTKTLNRGNFTVDFIMIVQTYIGDYLNHNGLWSGPPMNWGCLYPKKAKNFLKTKRKFYVIPEENSVVVKGNVFLERIALECFYMAENRDDIFVFNITEIERLFRLYFRKLTGIKTWAWVRHVNMIIKGINYLLKKFPGNKPHKINKTIEIRSISEVTQIQFGLDESLEEIYFFPIEFSSIFDKLSNSNGFPIIFNEYKDLDKFETTLNEMMSDYPAKSCKYIFIQTIIDMISTAKLKKVSINIRLMP